MTCLINQILEQELLNSQQMVNLKQSNITILNGNLTYSNLYFVYVLTIFQSIHKYFDTLKKILKHTHNIFTIALIMGFISNFINLVFIQETYENSLKYSMFCNMNITFFLKQSLLIDKQHDKELKCRNVVLFFQNQFF